MDDYIHRKLHELADAELEHQRAHLHENEARDKCHRIITELIIYMEKQYGKFYGNNKAKNSN